MRTLRFKELVVLAAVVLAMVVVASTGQAQAPAPTRPFTVLAQEWDRLLTATSQVLDQPGLQEPEKEQQRKRLTDVLAAAQQARGDAQGELDTAQKLLTALGPAPAEKEPPEAPAVIAQRDRYAEDVVTFKGRIAQADLVIARVKALRKKLDELGRNQFFSRILEKYPSFWSRAALGDLGAEGLAVAAEVGRAPTEWLNHIRDKGLQDFFLNDLLKVFLPVLIGGVFLRRWLLQKFGRDPAIETPPYPRMILAAIAEGSARGLIPVLFILVFLSRSWIDESGDNGLFIISVICQSLMLFVAVSALSKALLAPADQAWRVITIPSRKAIRLNRRIRFLVGVIAFDLAARQILAGAEASRLLLGAYELPSTLLMAAAILTFLRLSLWLPPSGDAPIVEPPSGESAPAARTVAEPDAGEPRDAPAQPSFRKVWAVLRPGVTCLALVAVAAAALGYANLAQYIVSNIVITALFAALAMLVRRTSREAGIPRRLAGAIARSLNLDPGHAATGEFWLRLVFDGFWLSAAILVVLPFWGVAPSQILHALDQVASGFQIGNVTISLAQIAIAFGIFVAVVVATRIIQNTLRVTLLPRTGIDPGIQNSVAAGVGYVGFILAFMFGISAIGLDLSQIALVAGALSVGIGFGLQNIVNNFVSGVILLLERPVKVGDWVVIGQYQGFIKHIKVRSTEIETFERASVIIPNADLLSNPVLNWTLRNRQGRIEIRVGVEYGSDPDLVETLLLRTAREHPKVMRFPAMFVLLDDFGASSLDFELRCFTNDVLSRLTIASDLRKRIIKEFAANGIQFAYPHTVVHVDRKQKQDQGGPLL
ncbi:MAG: mechanosensitive ion channel [Azospirillum sp.]|nr:mechanosensitive ion channel [Azospirillum sp.]